MKNNKLILADCLDLLKDWYNTGKTEFIDMIYIDPPFNSKRNYNIVFDSEYGLSEQAFKDTWSNVSYLKELDDINVICPELFSFLKMLETTGLPKSYLSYLTMMALRCWYMRKMLKSTGTFYYHCDSTCSHYIKIILDYIYGIGNFRNEIVWCYKGAGYPKKDYGNRHDIIFRYTKSNDFVFNLDDIREPYAKSTQERFKHHIGNVRNGRDFGQQSLNQKGKHPDDWFKLQPIAPSAKERLGYPTQKPEKLMERFILASSNEGDLVADFFCGCGTTIAVAKRLKRKWLGADINWRAIQVIVKRLDDIYVKKDYIIEGMPKSSKALRDMVDKNMLGKEKNSRFALEDVTCKYYLKNVVGNDKKVSDGSIDGRFGFEYKGEKMIGLVQVTSGSNINHFKAFCSEVGEKNIGVYISFKDRIPKSWYIKAKNKGKIGNCDRVQILTFEDLVDSGIQYKVPDMINSVFNNK